MRILASLMILSMTTAGAFAQAEKSAEGAVKIGKPAGVKLAKAECEAAWKKANPANKPTIGAGQAIAFVTDTKAVNANGDAGIDQKEFMAACDKGLMKDANAASTSSTGAGAGTEGKGPAATPPAPAPH
jgi:hypothetical protein